MGLQTPCHTFSEKLIESCHCQEGSRPPMGLSGGHALTLCPRPFCTAVSRPCLGEEASASTQHACGGSCDRTAEERRGQV